MIFFESYAFLFFRCALTCAPIPWLDKHAALIASYFIKMDFKSENWSDLFMKVESRQRSHGHFFITSPTVALMILERKSYSLCKGCISSLYFGLFSRKCNVLLQTDLQGTKHFLRMTTCIASASELEIPSLGREI